MCGIIAYTGDRIAVPLLINGLSKLEYRGYDSAGVYAPTDGLFRAVGAVKNLNDVLPKVQQSTSGIAHTRWATHGGPSERNAHPHASQNQTLYLVHNGIIENYRELKDVLVKDGHTFTSDTDSEVLAHLIGRAYEATQSAPSALASALSEVRGTYGVAVIFADAPDNTFIDIYTMLQLKRQPL